MHDQQPPSGKRTSIAVSRRVDEQLRELAQSLQLESVAMLLTMLGTHAQAARSALAPVSEIYRQECADIERERVLRRNLAARMAEVPRDVLHQMAALAGEAAAST